MSSDDNNTQSNTETSQNVIQNNDASNNTSVELIPQNVQNFPQNPATITQPVEQNMYLTNVYKA